MTGPVYNSNTTGGLLQGIGDLLRGISNFNDPDRAKREQMLQLLQTNPQIRDQYIQQFKDNPDAINAILGKKPMFGSPGSYNELYSTLQGKMSPQGQAAAAKANADILEAQNRSTKESALAPILTQGAKVDAFVNRGVGGVNQPAPTEQTPGIENISVVKGPGISNEDYQRYQEAMSGKILTPQEREAQQALTEREQILTQRAKESIPLERSKDQAIQEKLAQDKADKLTTEAILAQYPKGNLYDLNVAGKITNAQVAAITRHNKDLWDKHQNAHFDEERLTIERNNSERLKDQVTNQKKESLRNQIYNEALRAGSPISLDQVEKAIDSPNEMLASDAPEDQPVKEALIAIRKYAAKSGPLEKAKAQFIGAYKSWNSALKGKEPNDSDIERLNNESKTAFMGSGYQPFIFGLTPTKDMKGMIFKSPRMVEGITSADPTLIKDAPAPIIKLETTTPNTKTKPTGNPSTTTRTTSTTQLSDADKFEVLKKKYPKETAAQIVARMGKGEQ